MLVAPFGARHLLTIDPEAGEVAAVDLGHDLALFGVTLVDDAVLALTTDGLLRVADPATGETHDHLRVLGPCAEGDPGEPYRRLVVAGGHAYISDTSQNAIVEVALTDLEVTRVIELDITPGFLGVAGR